MLRIFIAFILYMTYVFTDMAPGPIQEETVTDICIYHPQDAYKPEVDEVTLRDEDGKGLMGTAWISDIYQVDILASGVVGLVGAPFEVSYDTAVRSPMLTFHYVADELRGIPEENLIILHYDQEEDFYVQVGEEELDKRQATVSVSIEEPGVYLLADKYQWYSVWGVDMSEYAYAVTPGMYASDWERECDTGSILEIADTEWALENAPYFYVSTPEQLAGVVYYVNAINAYGEDIYLYLEDDIDLAGLDWVPMGWGGAGNNCCNGLIDGQGYGIYNMDLHIPYDNRCAFVGYATGLTVCDISFCDAGVCGGRYTGIIGGEIYMSDEWENIHVDGVISDALDEVGSIVGREAYLNFKNCSADVVYLDESGNASQLAYFSHRQEVLANTPATEDFQLTLHEDGSITRTDADGFRNLCWHVDVDGRQLLQRGAEGEYTFNPSDYIEIPEDTVCRVWLEAFTGETYTRVSNVVERHRRTH